MIHVTCAIIEWETKVLCAQRSELMPLPLKWEFPGGKLEAGEELEACIIREIKEELGVDIYIKDKLPISVFDYGDARQICLYPFICHIELGTIQLKEHKQVLWLPVDELKSLDWAAADIPILDHYLARKKA